MHYTVSDYLLDIIQNGIEAGGTEIGVELEEDGTSLSVRIRDNGCGMDAATRKKALDPFHTDGIKHPGRKVGLGLPFLQQATDATGGTLDILSEPGKGTEIRFSFPSAHLDAPPLGNLCECMTAALCFEGDFELRFDRKRKDDSYSFSRKELQEALGDLDSVGSISLLREYLESLEDTHGEDNT